MAQQPPRTPRANPPTDAAFEAASRALDLIDANKVVEAEAVCRRALIKNADHPHLLRVLANALLLQRQFPQAQHYMDRAGEVAPPGDAMFLMVLARMRRQIDPDEKALDLFERAVKIDPMLVEAWLGISDLCLMTGRYARARDACVQGLGYFQGHPDIWHNYCVALQLLGRAEESFVAADDLVRAYPAYPHGLLVRASTAMHAGMGNPEALKEDIRRYWILRGAASAVPPAHSPAALAAAREAATNGQLRVALVSPDFRQHSVAYFVEPLMEASDPARVSFFCYSNVTREDATSARLKALAGLWRGIALSSVGNVATMIRADAPHVCLDLAGHTAGSALAALAFKPAIVQGSYCGYPGTTGLDAVDFRIVDSHTDPSGDPFDAKPHSTEHLIRLDPCFLCYRPPMHAPPVAPGPSSRGEPFTFGSFNALKKLSRSALDAWGRVLTAVPDSRLIIKTQALKDEATRTDTLARLASVGVDPARVELLLPTEKAADHLALYSRVDVALDSFPYNGTTTTCEALLMGVPVVSIAGTQHAARVGLSLLTNVGLPHLCAKDVDGYVEAARALAADREGLAALRSTLRDRLRASPLCDAKAYASRFEAALRDAVLRKVGPQTA
jgi:predicted O-linked N-acetylglucosamine transferase (SPINDLY family)